LKNLQQVGEWVEVYYKCLFKLTNCLQMKAINVFLSYIFKASLQPYFKLATSVIRDTMIKHKKVAMICEENGLIIHYYQSGVQFINLNHNGTLKVK
jgi:hypothetical protein